MSNWNDQFKSRETDPLQRLIEEENNREEARESSDDGTTGEKQLRKEYVRDLLRRLLLKNRGLYIVFLEFIFVSGGTIISNNDAPPQPKAPWGFYRDYSKRWKCSERAIRKWVKEALLLLASLNRENSP